MEPTTTPPVASDSPVPPPKKAPATNSKKKKTIIIGSIIGVIALVVMLVCLYLFWYQNPQKVVTDAIINATKAEQSVVDGNLNLKVQGSDIKVDFDGEGNQKVGKASLSVDVKIQDTQLKTTADVVAAENGDYYIRANNVQQAADALIEQLIGSYSSSSAPADLKDKMRAQFKAQFDPIVAKIDNRWIHISAEDTKDANKEVSKVQTCVNEVRTLIHEDKSASRELSDAYKKHQFIRIDEKLGSQDGALGYKVSIDNDAAGKFEEATKDSKIAKKLNSCTDTTASDDTSTENTDSSTAEMTVWIRRWAHTVDKITLSAKEDDVDMQLEMNFDFNKAPVVETPKGAAPLKEVISEIEVLMSTESATEL